MKRRIKKWRERRERNILRIETSQKEEKRMQKQCNKEIIREWKKRYE